MAIPLLLMFHLVAPDPRMKLLMTWVVWLVLCSSLDVWMGSVWVKAALPYLPWSLKMVLNHLLLTLPLMLIFLLLLLILNCLTS